MFVCVQCILASLHKHEAVICGPMRQVGRYYLILQMAIARGEIKCPSCPWRGTSCQSQHSDAPSVRIVYKSSLHFKLFNCNPCDHKPYLLPSVKQSSVKNMGWEGNCAVVLV